jgi:hypothetical protein
VIKDIQQAIAELKHDPGKTITAEVEGLVIELRCARCRTASEIFEDIGPWEGESEEELTQLLREARTAGGSGETPVF